MRRLNVKLALWLLGITIFSVVGVHFLHGYQLDRNADFLKVQAEEAQKAGDPNEAIKKYNQYLRHRDDREGYKALAELVVEQAKEADATPRDKFRAYTILEEAIRRHEDLDDVRASLIDYTMMMRRFGEAKDHINTLQDHGKITPALEFKSALCDFYGGNENEARKKLYAIVGFDPNLRQFAAEAPATAKEIEPFLFLTQTLRQNKDNELADTVMRQLVTWNPESARAHLALGQDLLARWEGITDDVPDAAELRKKHFAEGKVELEKAFELDPKNADVLLAVATASMLEANFDRAAELLERARKEHPDRQEVYVRLSELALSRGETAKATEALQRGLKESPNVRRILEQLVEVQFQMNDLAAVRATCEQMKKVDAIPGEFVTYQEARLKLAEGNVTDATRDFERVRPAMERLGTEHAQRINSILAKCYEMLGLTDRQLEIYDELLRTYPNLLMARLGQAAALQNQGRFEEAATSVVLLANAVDKYPPIQGSVLQVMVAQEMNKPREERNWEGVDKVVAQIALDKNQTPLRLGILKAELLMLQERDDEARELLTALRKENPKELLVWMSLTKLMRRDPKTRDRIPQLLELAEKEVGDVLPLRLERMQAILAARGENAAEELKKLEEGIDKFDEGQQRALTLQVGLAFLQIGKYEEGKRRWLAVLAKDPTNASLRQLFFEAAQESKDSAGMAEAVKELRESRNFGPESSLYKYCDASRRLFEFTQGRKGKTTPLSDADHKTLADIRQQIDEALAERGGWAPLYRVRAEVEQLLGNVDGAISNYQRSLRFSQVRQSTVARRLVTLLYATQRFAEAKDALQYLSDAEIPEEMRQLVGDINRRGGDPEAALAMALKDIEAHPTDARKLCWYGQMLDEQGKGEEAEAAYRKATTVDPKVPLAWELLVQKLMANRKKNEAVEAARQASKALADDPLAVAIIFRRVDDAQQAEQLYKSALAAKPDDLPTLQQAAEFYIASKQYETAIGYLNQMIEKGPKSSDKRASDLTNWSRRRKAQCLALPGDYTNVMSAVKLIEQNAKDGKLSRLDMLSVVDLLADRGEHDSRVKAIEMLEKLRQSDGLTAGQMSALGRLYNREGNWEKSNELMLAAANSGSDSPEILILYAELLLVHDNAEEAAGFVARAEELIAKSPTPVSPSLKEATTILRARFLAREGKSQEAADLMEGMLARPLPQNQLTRLAVVAMQMEQLGLLEATERLLTEYMSQDVRGAIALGAFKGRQGKVQEAFSLLEEARKNQATVEILAVALEMLRYYPDEVTAERCQKLEEWAKGALGTEADQDRVKLLLAELYDLQARYDEVVDIYRGILSDPNSPLAAKAVAQNNLAFVLAAVKPTPQRIAESLDLIEASIKVLGPRADLLDTRAVALLAQGKVEAAAADARVAAADIPSVPKYYHLAQIEKQLGKTEAARAAMTKAQELNDDHNPFTPVERAEYEKLRQELNITQAPKG